MRISRKIGISFFITFLLVILLGALSIYSLRHIYRGLNQVFAKDLPASRSTYQIAVSMEDVLSELNNFLITGNENFKVSFERSYEKLQDDMSGLKRFVVKEEEKGLFEEAQGLSEEINRLSNDIFKKKAEIKALFKDVRARGVEYKQKLDRIFDFEEQKMLGEKDLLLIQAQYIPASQLIMEASSRFSNLLDGLAGYVIGNEKDAPLSFMDDLLALDKSVRDYKNYYGYSLSDKERAIATELMGLSGEIRSIIDSICDLKDQTEADMGSLLVKEKAFMEAMDKIIALKKSGISSKLGVGATLTEDIPAIHNISNIEKDVAESWRSSSRYILTGDETYRDSYYRLRQNIEEELKDYARHARLRGTEKFLDDIVEADRSILEAIDLNMDTLDIKDAGLSNLASMKADLEKNIEEILKYNDSLIKEAQAPRKVLERNVPARWVIMRFRNELSVASGLVANYLDEQDARYKDAYSESYFDMKKYLNKYRNISGTDNAISFIEEIESGLDKFNTAVLDVIDSHDKIIKEQGWSLVKLEDALRQGMDKAIEVEISQIDKNKEDIKNRIAMINTLIFIIIGGVALIAIFIIFYTVNSITNPIQKLYDGAGVIGSGNLDHRLDIKTGDEIQDLAEGFNAMAGELKELYTNLENKVKERTRQLAEANNTLAFRKDELEKINAQLKDLDRMKSDFVSNVVHELRTPLTIIKGNVDTIEKGYAGKVQPKQKEVLGDVYRVTNRLARLVNDLLDLSKIESGKMDLKKEDVDIVEMAKEIVRDFEKVASQKQIEIKGDLPNTGIVIKADRDKLTQVFVNLIGNAVKFTDKGDVGVKIVELQDEVQVEIEDTGPGMTKEECEKIFDKFVRVVAEKKEGTGLGLPIAKDIVGLHKGRMRIESSPGKGSIFIFNLPK